MGQRFRVGQGYDIHRLQAGGRLVLGGVTVSEELSPIAHSDGDVVIHALVDALLGAIGQGDIGDHFPPSDPTLKNADSKRFLNHAMDLIRREGFRVVNADLTVLAERPKLGAFKKQIVRNLQALIGASVNLKAGTNEGCDAVGQGQAIAAQAIVLLVGEG